MNFHLANGVYFRRTDEDRLLIVRAKDFADAGEVLVETDINGLASVVSSFSPLQEQCGSFQYIYEFLKDGVMYCGGCGLRMKKEDQPMMLSIVSLVSCQKCYEQKFKPLFDWGLK